MRSTARQLLLTGTVLAGLVLPAAAGAQDDLSDVPAVRSQPPASLRATPTPTATPAATPLTVAAPSANPGDALPDTGSDAQTLAFAGLSLLLFGASLRLQVSLRDGRG